MSRRSFAQANPYILENQNEFSRLEKQSSYPEYDFRSELRALKIPVGGKVLDAGCGSGLVTRYLAQTYPTSIIIGCDASEVRIAQAEEASRKQANIEFQVDDISHTRFKSETFDAIVCRYVMQHLSASKQRETVNELSRCLKPGGVLYMIDADGILANLYPQSLELKNAMNEVQSKCSIDLYSGRKIPFLLYEAGIVGIETVSYSVNFTGEALQREIELMATRLESATPALIYALGDELTAKKFKKEYLKALNAPGSFYFHTMFIVIGNKPRRS